MDGYVDLDLLSISLKDVQESWEERERSKLSNINNGGEKIGNKLGKLGSLWGRRPLK